MRYLSFSLIILFVSCSLSNNDQQAKQLFEAFNAHDWQRMSSLYANDAEFLDPAFGVEYVKKSQAEIVEKYSEMEKMFPNLHDEVKGIYASGDKVTIEFISSGSSGDSINFKLPICTVLLFVNGKIVRDATYYNNQ